jgi:two-component system chemotaxis response regulator CheY
MGHSILIVDDSATTRAFIRRAVQMVGILTDTIQEAADGAAGLALLRTHRFDLVFADLHMPIMDGAEMVRKMWADATLKDVSVLIVSADPNTERLDALRAEGACGYLRKPFTPEDFQSAVKPFLGVQA